MKTIYTILLFGLIALISCDKREYLAAKPDQAMIIPATLDDLQAILDNTLVFNGMQATAGSGIVPILGQTASDDYFFGRPDLFASASAFTKNTYIWDREDIYAGLGIVTDWSQPYQGILYANICLSQYEKLTSDEQRSAQGLAIKGAALFHRAHLYHQLAQIFAPVYQKDNATETPGLPLRVQADVNEALHRNTLEETYAQIVADLTSSLEYLPQTAPYTTRPTVTAAHALLARVYLSMSDYPNALLHADRTLEKQEQLMDYNRLDSMAVNPFLKDNEETIFTALISLGGTVITAFRPNYASVDADLVKSYAAGDLRRPMFMTKRTESQSLGMRFKGSYFGGTAGYFAGLATDEIYLIKAECLARDRQIPEALIVLNTLLIKRFDSEKFSPLDSSDPEEVLRLVLAERRKELLFRGLRWTDLRRLNLDPRFAITLVRQIGDIRHELPPGDPRYTFPIPSEVMGFYPEMPQNPR